jgi:hypothetical protein
MRRPKRRRQRSGACARPAGRARPWPLPRCPAGVNVAPGPPHACAQAGGRRVGKCQPGLAAGGHALLNVLVHGGPGAEIDRIEPWSGSITPRAWPAAQAGVPARPGAQTVGWGACARRCAARAVRLTAMCHPVPHSLCRSAGCSPTRYCSHEGRIRGASVFWGAPARRAVPRLLSSAFLSALKTCPAPVM